MPEVKGGDYWIIGFDEGDGASVSYTVGEISADSEGKLWCFVPGNEVEMPLKRIDVWVRKVEMPC